MKNNTLTASRMNTAMRCLRQHYWRYEIGLQRDETPLALQIGSAWARAMEARFKGQPMLNALDAALPDTALDPYTATTIGILLEAYYDYWPTTDTINMTPETQFKEELQVGEELFLVEGKMDALGSVSGQPMLVECKTTGESVLPDSGYWLRLAFNLQILQYASAAWTLGYDISAAFYDVVHKPGIKPKQVPDLDKQGLKVVLDSAGNRVFKKDGSPRESGDTEKGFVVKSHLETPQEYGARLLADIRSRPDFYFARKEIPIMESDIEAFRLQRMAIAKLILSLRESEQGLSDPSNAWPRHCDKMICGGCQFASFCLQNISVDPVNPPQGFTVKPFNPELEKIEIETEVENNS